MDGKMAGFCNDKGTETMEEPPASTLATAKDGDDDGATVKQGGRR